ncbi:MAG: NAD(P)/FAD-dependent oxidoreductase [Pseudomonadota bacterium]|uniref:NAD(P)/FAD-dependent oxidoreductase n=1 Tax=Roseovarius TaxID=74030 RepID=UPI0022A66D86|nr:NAD(P)/FAD-dependent oxidoreductase [Roseovarius sp. EGI FJ00037]MCZ0811545.1 NAD(P)/FAD-dependent oxidoreductase [Roseovarius sp. EGI FJ00037]HKL46310.1 NAD(P)/FAD-dependent oxidoreductase [Roseovarius sp.]
MQDVIVIGGGYAGMAATLQLVRARRSVMVIDAGLRRNRTASHSYGFLGQDGVDPAELARTARTQLEAYPTLTWKVGEVATATGANDAFKITLAAGESFAARRLLFATGVADELPQVPGLAERWGQSVFHCPYCHGYELDQGNIGVIATGPMSLHQAQLLTDWGKITFMTNATFSLDDDALADLNRRGVDVEQTPIDRIEGEADVVLTDGRRLHFAGLFTASRCSPTSPVAETMGCDVMETPMGSQLRTSEEKETSIGGAFACGDVARVPHSVSLAVADGAWAGAQVHRSLVWPTR